MEIVTLDKRASDLANEISDAIVKATKADMSLDIALCVVVQVAADYGGMVKPVLFILLGAVTIMCSLWCGVYHNGNSLVMVAFWMIGLVAGAAVVIYGSFWFMIAAESASVFCGHCGASATTYGRAENVGIVPVVVAEFEFRDIERQIFAADLVEAARPAYRYSRMNPLLCRRSVTSR